MKLNYYSLYDKTGEEFYKMFPAKNDGIAARTAQQVMKDVPLELQNDFSLLQVGVVNFTTGELINIENRKIEKAPTNLELITQESNKDGNNNTISKHRSGESRT